MDPPPGDGTRFSQSFHNPASALFVLKDGLPTIAARTATESLGLEYALDTDVLTSDRNNARNLTRPTFDPMGQVMLSFGRNSATQFGTLWKLYRSTDLSAWTEIYSFDGSNQTFDRAKFSATLGASSITLIDKNPPFPKAFYQFKAVLAP